MISRNRTASGSHSQIIQVTNFRPNTNLSFISNDARVRTLSNVQSKQTVGIRAKSSKRAQLRAAVETKKILQNLSILDIHQQTRIVKKHKPLDLSPFLIEQPERKDGSPYNLPTNIDIEIQCDEVTPRPITPYKIKGKTGLDVAIQCESQDLFDFDRDVQPLLDVIVDKTLDQSLTEIRNEHVLKTLKTHHTKLQQSAEAEKHRVRQMEEADRQRFQAKEKLLEEKLYQQRKENALKQKAMATRIAQHFLQDITNDVLNNLEELSIFRSPIVMEIEANFIPQIADNAWRRIALFDTINKWVDDVLKNTVSGITDCAQKQSEVIAKQQEMADVIHLYVNVDDDPQKIGPLKLTKFDHINNINKTIREWYLNEKQDKLENAIINLTFNGKAISEQQCLGNLDLQTGVFEMKIVRQDPRKQDQEQEEEEEEDD